MYIYIYTYSYTTNNTNNIDTTHSYHDIVVVRSDEEFDGGADAGVPSYPRGAAHVVRVGPRRRVQPQPGGLRESAYT